jgi:hypothetical protein
VQCFIFCMSRLLGMCFYLNVTAVSTALEPAGRG